ncbi:biotin-dependent carboxyltransferase family protein [Cognatishimia sp.]|uniref:5-oxoprolinase subunit C family protein n=1 Tax=Cognatishimia sp. TaxID=2211648 RepID=UPI003511ACF3
MSVLFHGNGPAISIQDLGRPGQIAAGLSRGGAMDRLALFEAAALLQAPQVLPALEVPGFGGAFTFQTTTRIALTGAPMAATLDGSTLAWNRTHLIPAGAKLTLGACVHGSYGYVTFAGGIESPVHLGSQAAHLMAGIGQVLSPGAEICIGADPDHDAAQMGLVPDARLDGGVLHVVAGPQTDLFETETQQAFFAATFTKSNRANRQGIGLDHPSLKFGTDQAAGLASDFIMQGDIQQTGDGVPYVLMAECQTMGGYPRIGTVIPDDLPKLAQAQPGKPFTFKLISRDDAESRSKSEADILKGLRAKVAPVVRNPADMSDLLSYQLISGVTAGHDPED